MEIILQYFDGCPNWRTTVTHLKRLIDDGVDAAIRLELIDTEETAVKRGFRGSPTVLIDGNDPFADGDAPVGFTCRVYQTEHGLAGSPSLLQLRQATITARGGT